MQFLHNIIPTIINAFNIEDISCDISFLCILTSVVRRVADMLDISRLYFCHFG